MSEIRTFFRHCPACGRRFEIRLEGKSLIGVDRATSTLPVMESSMDRGSLDASMPLVVGEGEPITVDVEKFRYAYRCKHCDHEWSEMHEKTKRE